MYDPLRAKAKVVFLSTVVCLLGLGIASGLGWTRTSHAMPTVLESPQVSPEAVQPALDLSAAFTNLADAVTPSVVRIESRRQGSSADNGQQVPEAFRRFFDVPEGEPRPRINGGSGFLVSADGYILTNNHVVENADVIKITLQNEKKYEAKLIGSDSKTDIALLKIVNTDNKHFPYLTLGNSENVEVGEWVVAIGNPFGLDHTVTAGVVSAKARNIGAGPYDEYIQTDASINPGNSGGPLLNMNGEVIGINTAIFSRTGGNVGIGFTIPIKMASDILDELKKDGKVTRGWLGVMIQKITPELAETFKLSDSHGALINDVVPNGPAARGGLKRGDVIVKFNGVEIVSVQNLPKQVAAVDPGKSVDCLLYTSPSPRDATLSRFPSWA